MAVKRIKGVKGNEYNFYQFEADKALTDKDIRTITGALDRSITKWGELSTGDKTSAESRAYNLSQAQALAEIKALIKSLPVEEGEGSSSKELPEEYAKLLG